MLRSGYEAVDFQRQGKSMENACTSNTVAIILAGGGGKRMDILCHLRPKPSLPFAGTYRVVDFSLSNCLHSQISQVAALVDYQRTAMTRYLKEWLSSNQGLRSLDILMPETGSYSGTTDAVFQNLDYLRKCSRCQGAGFQMGTLKQIKTDEGKVKKTMLLILKSCPRYKGDMLVEKNSHDQYEWCLQCGYHLEIKNALKLRLRPENMRQIKAVLR